MSISSTMKYYGSRKHKNKIPVGEMDAFRAILFFIFLWLLRKHPSFNAELLFLLTLHPCFSNLPALSSTPTTLLLLTLALSFPFLIQSATLPVAH